MLPLLPTFDHTPTVELKLLDMQGVCHVSALSFYNIHMHGMACSIQCQCVALYIIWPSRHAVVDSQIHRPVEGAV